MGRLTCETVGGGETRAGGAFGGALAAYGVDLDEIGGVVGAGGDAGGGGGLNGEVARGAGRAVGVEAGHALIAGGVTGETGVG